MPFRELPCFSAKKLRRPAVGINDRHSSLARSVLVRLCVVHDKGVSPAPKSRAVHILVDAQRIADGTTLEFRAATGPERRALTPWLAEDPRRGQATWTNHRGTPLVWAADGKRYSPTGLVMHMLRQVGAKAKAVQGTSRWFVPGEGSLTVLADEVRGEEMT
jgi:hypothetical protein